MTTPPEPEIAINAVLTFRDESDREWLAGAQIGPLVRYVGTDEREVMSPGAMKDRAFALHGIKLVDAESAP